MSLSTITFYPVDNGSMTLIKLNDDNETTLLIDMHVRVSTNDENDVETYDVLGHLRNQLNTDSKGRPYIDAFLLTHNDKDHIMGVQKYFHLGSIEDYEEPEDEDTKKIILNEIWSSGRFWKRDSTYNILHESAKAYNKEMKRRVIQYQENEEIQLAGDRAIILCEDDEEKTDNLSEIIRQIDSEFSIINEKNLSSKINIKVLSPLPKYDDEDESNFKDKNRGSVVILITIKEGGYYNQILLTGDAPVFVWEKLWEKYQSKSEVLRYDILLTPHHCSWHSISNVSWSQSDKPEVSKDALSALSQVKTGAYIISSSKPIKNDDNDPPSFAAKQKYEILVDEGHFLCTEEYPNEKEIEPIVFNLTNLGPQLKQLKAKSKLYSASLGATGEAFPHG